VGVVKGSNLLEVLPLAVSFLLGGQIFDEVVDFLALLLSVSFKYSGELLFVFLVKLDLAELLLEGLDLVLSGRILVRNDLVFVTFH